MPANRTPSGKRVKQLSIGTPKQAITAGETFTLPAWGVVLAPDDIRIIGFDLVLISDGWPDAPALGEQDCSCLIGRVASNSLVDNFGMTRTHVSIFACTVGDDEVIGNKVGEKTVMFPEGYGIDVDENEGIYLNAYLAQRGLVELDMFANAMVYYVER